MSFGTQGRCLNRSSAEMLFRASSRPRLPRPNVQLLASQDRIFLPFLYPTILKQSAIRPYRAQPTSPEHINHLSKHVPRLTSRRDGLHQGEKRGLASAIAIERETNAHEYIPLELSSRMPNDKSTLHSFQKIYPLHGFDSSGPPLILDTPPPVPPPTLRSYDAVSADVNEIHQTLHACLQVGRLARAAVLVRRLSNIYVPDAPGLLAAHKDYMRELTLQIIRSKDMQLLQDLLSWFEVEVRQRHIPTDAATFALLIQAAAQDLDTKRSSRTIRRYYSFAATAGLENETRALCPEVEKVLEEMVKPQEPEELLPAPTALIPAELPSQAKLPSELRSVDMKGYGLSTLLRSLGAVKDFKQVDLMTPRALSDHKSDVALQRQRSLEKSSVSIAVDRWRLEDAQLKKIGINGAVRENPSIGALMWKWHERLMPELEKEFALIDAAEKSARRSVADNERMLWAPYLQGLHSETISAASILACTNALATSDNTEGLRVPLLLRVISSALMSEVKAKHSGNSKQRSALAAKFNKIGKRLDEKEDSFSGIANADSQTWKPDAWPNTVACQIGAMVLSKIIAVAKVDVKAVDRETGNELRETMPAFFHTFIYAAGKKIGVIRFSPAMMDKLAREPLGSVLAKHLPMVAPPRPWTDFREGGFLEHSLKVVRFNSQDKTALKYAATAAGNGDMQQVFEGLNVLARTPWKINAALFEIMAEAWNTGEPIANLPPANPVIPNPPKPQDLENVQEQRAWLKKVKENENYKTGLRSNRCFINFQMEIARAFIGETIYFPHNIDFRGRAYPMAPLFNHMGADNARGLLLFANGRKLGERGLYWLKIHLASVYGYDKANFVERQDFTEQNIDNVHDSVLKPYTGTRWWLKAEDPWQCLAACIELHNALKLDDPTEFISHLPIHQDGTCNGLQHYAALGGDRVGAKQVNLEPGDRPADVYSAVAQAVKTEVHNDAINFGENQVLAKFLDGRITRKVVKQTVMTNVYGVTFYGAKQQVRRQLEDVIKDFPDQKQINKSTASEYVASKIFKTLGHMFTGAHEIQYWLGECASRICESISPAQIEAMQQHRAGIPMPSVFKPPKLSTRLKKASRLPPEMNSFISPVIWTSPLRLPVVQPYRKSSAQVVRTQMQKLSLEKVSELSPVHKARQLQAFPPNFIHSLDGSHMFLTALRCSELGLSFASVHDSFWTHAADVDSMNEVTRDAFIRMHSEDIIGRLAAEFRTRYAGHFYIGHVPYNCVAAERVRAWRRTNKFPRTEIVASRKVGLKVDEMLMEQDRLSLLASNEPAERRKGEKMVTPGSIIAAATPDELRGVERKTKRSSKVTTAAQEASRVKLHAEVDVEKDAGQNDLVIEEDIDTFGEEGDLSDIDEIAFDDEGPETVKAVTKARKTQVWLPMDFPPVPVKGDFDVRRLKTSRYFFS